LEWLAVVSSLIAAIGLIFTGYQVYLLNRQARQDRRVVLDGVAAAWRPVQAPSHPEEGDGTSTWQYQLVLVNPGRLPIDDVQIKWFFPCQVVRLRHKGVTDKPTSVLTLSAPVLVGGGERTWERWLRIDYSQKANLAATYAEVSFNDIDGQRHTNRWPRRQRRPLGPQEPNYEP
jgi:hypothetical protein